MRIFIKVAVLSVALASLSLTGCAVENEGEGTLAEASSAISFESKTFEGCWPGNRVYQWWLGDGREIDPSSVILTVSHQDNAGAKELRWELTNNNRNIVVNVTMHEGDVFNPAKHKVTVMML